MSRDVKKYTLLDAAEPKAIESTTNASPIVVTSTAHGYSTGQKVAIVGHTVNTNANGAWKINVLDDDTFELVGSEGNGAGGADGIHYVAYKTPQVGDHRHAVLAFDSDGSGVAAMTAKLVGSIQDELPNFAAPAGPGNQYTTIQMLELKDSVEVDGDDGITLATEDINRMFEANVNGLKWLAVILTEGTAGKLTVRVNLLGNSS